MNGKCINPKPDLIQKMICF